MFIEINPSAGLPIYLQIMNQMKYAIAAGALRPGDQLPPVRELAAQLRINPNTVAKAYRELQHEKIVTAKWGGGCFVTDEGRDISKKEKLRIVADLLDNALVQAFHLNLSPGELRKLLDTRLQKLQQRAKSERDS